MAPSVSSQNRADRPIASSTSARRPYFAASAAACAAVYVARTGDSSLFDQVVPFLEAPPLEPGQSESYGLPSVSPQAASVLETDYEARHFGTTGDFLFAIIFHP